MLSRDVIYPIWELPTRDLPDLHDGSLDDWESALPNASLNQSDFVYYVTSDGHNRRSK